MMSSYHIQFQEEYLELQLYDAPVGCKIQKREQSVFWQFSKPIFAAKSAV